MINALIGAGIATVFMVGLMFYAVRRQRKIKQAKPLAEPMRGVGDLVSKVIGSLKDSDGERMIPECGGCKGRRARLNQILPFRGKVTASEPRPGTEPPEWIREVEEQGGDAAAFLAGWLSCQTALAKMELPNRQVFEACLAEWTETGRLLSVGQQS